MLLILELVDLQVNPGGSEEALEEARGEGPASGARAQAASCNAWKRIAWSFYRPTPTSAANGSTQESVALDGSAAASKLVPTRYNIHTHTHTHTAAAGKLVPTRYNTHTHTHTHTHTLRPPESVSPAGTNIIL